MHHSRFLATLALVSLLTDPARANLVVNGSFEDPASPGSNFISFTGLTRDIDIPGWTTTSDLSILVTPPSASPTNYTLVSQPTSLSPDGGNFLATDGSFGLGTLTQTLTGLVPSKTYTLSFYQAAGQLNGNIGATEEQWVVTVGGTLGTTNSVTLPDATTWSPYLTSVVVSPDDEWMSPLMSIPSAGFSGWQQETYSFVASSTSELLGFLAVGAPLGLPPLVLLDGVSVQAAAAPEPRTVALVLVGLAGLMISRRRRAGRRRDR